MRFLLCLIVVSALQATALAEQRPSLFTSLVVKDATPEKGVRAVSVAPNSFCGVAGIQAGDIIVQLDGKPVDSLERYVEVSRGVLRNDSVDMTILHDGNKIDLTIKRAVERTSRPTDTEALPSIPASAEAKREYYESGQLKSELHVKDGKPDGPTKMYYESGQLKSEKHYKDGKPEGKHKKYYETGQVEEEVNFRDGKQDGTYKKYYEGGQLMAEAHYKDGKKDGTYKKYYWSGQLEGEANFKNGVIISEKKYDSDGNLESD